MKAWERLINYVTVRTPSDEESETVPSSVCQFDLARKLEKEMKELGESLLDGGRWEQVLEYLKQEPTIGENVYVFRCAAASEAVAWVSPQDVSLGEYLLGLLENNPNGSPGQAVTLREVYHEFYERGALSELPELKIYGKELEVKF